MLTVHNRTDHTLRVPLPGHKFLHLGPQQHGEVSDHAASFAPLLRLTLSGELALEVAAAPGPPKPTPLQPRRFGSGHSAPRRAGVRGDR